MSDTMAAQATLLHHLDRVLTSADELTSEVAAARSRCEMLAGATDLADIHASFGALAQDLVQGRDRVRKLTRELAQARVISYDLGWCGEHLAAYDRALRHMHAVAYDLARARDLARGHRSARTDLARSHGSARMHDVNDLHEVDHSVTVAADSLARFMDEIWQVRTVPWTPMPGGRRASAASRLTESLLALELQLLPTQHRARYAEEFHAELHDLAQARATKALQFLYALQQLRRVWQLRAALQAPYHPRLHRLHRLACWILSSDWRTWGLLGPLMAFAIVNVFLQQGWGSAFFTIPAIVAFYAGVEWLRSRWSVKVKPGRRGRNSTAK